MYIHIDIFVWLFLKIFYTQPNDNKHSNLIEITSTQLYGFKYFYQTLMILSFQVII